MQVTRILAIRHGETAWNADGRVQGHRDIELNERGREQALALAAVLAGEAIDAVYSSDLQRARETAEAFALPAGLTVRTDAQLRERTFGRLEGFTFAEIEQRWPDDAARWRRREPDFAVGGGESLLVFYARCVEAATRLAADGAIYAEAGHLLGAPPGLRVTRSARAGQVYYHLLRPDPGAP